MPLELILHSCLLFVPITHPIQVDTPLHSAVETGDVVRVRQLLEKGANINALGKTGSTPLHYAQTPEVIELLLKHKPDLTIRDRTWTRDDQPMGLTALQSVAEHLARVRDVKSKSKYKQLIEAYRKSGVESDLITAIYLDDRERVKKLLSQSPLWADDFQGKSPLRIAASVGKTEICKHILDNFKVDVDDVERGQGHPILVYAMPFPAIVKMLTEKNADLKARISFRGLRFGNHITIIGSGATLLHYAVRDGKPESVQLLIDAGVDIFSKPLGKPEYTPLEVASTCGQADNAQVILDHPDFKTLNAKSRQVLLDKCLMLAVDDHWHWLEAARYKLVQHLIAHGANPKATADSKSAIQVAARNIILGQEENEADMQQIVLFLRKKGAAFNLTDAVSLRDEEAVAGLLKLESKSVSEHRTDGATPLHLAVLLNEKKIAKLLLDSAPTYMPKTTAYLLHCTKLCATTTSPWQNSSSKKEQTPMHVIGTIRHLSIGLRKGIKKQTTWNCCSVSIARRSSPTLTAL